MSSILDSNRTYRKGDRVQWSHKANVLHGTVKSSRLDRITVTCDDGKGIVRGFARLFQPSTVPAPPPIAPKHRFAVGDRVQCFDKRKNVTHVGTVTMARTDRIRARLDGSADVITGHISLFEPSAVPAAPLPTSGNDALDRYAVTDYKAYPKMSEETTAYTATITLEGVVVCGARNDGQGGCDLFTQLPGSPATVEDFQLACARWATAHGVEGETMDLWVEWFVNERPAGVSAAHFLAPIAKSQAEIREARAREAAEPVTTTDTAVGSRFILRESTRDGRLPYEAKIIDTETGIEVAVRPMDIRPTRELLEALFPVVPVCDECGASIPNEDGGSLVNVHHNPSCSLFPEL